MRTNAGSGEASLLCLINNLNLNLINNLVSAMGSKSNHVS